MKSLAEKVLIDKNKLNSIGLETLQKYADEPPETDVRKFLDLPIPKPLSNIEIFQLYIRMNNAKVLFSTQQEVDKFILSILEYIDYNGFKPFSTIKGEGNFPQEYDCNCINKYRSLYGLSLYTYIEDKGIV